MANIYGHLRLYPSSAKQFSTEREESLIFEKFLTKNEKDRWLLVVSEL